MKVYATITTPEHVFKMSLLYIQKRFSWVPERIHNNDIEGLDITEAIVDLTSMTNEYVKDCKISYEVTE